MPRRYTVTALKTPPGWQSLAWDINDQGEVVGEIYSREDSGYSVAVWSGGRLNRLPDSFTEGLPKRDQRSLNNHMNAWGDIQNRLAVWQNGEFVARDKATSLSGGTPSRTSDGAMSLWEFYTRGQKRPDTLPADLRSWPVYGNVSGTLLGIIVMKPEPDQDDSGTMTWRPFVCRKGHV